MEDVFRALAAPPRRALLDALRDRDGQTLGELCAAFSSGTHAMTRFGVMSHLGVLETADLIATRRDGRRKLHYLNPVPIRELHDRWVSRFIEAEIRGLVGLKRHLEATMPTPDHVFAVHVRGTPERVWQAMTDPDETAAWNHGLRVESAWEVGGPLRYVLPDGTVATEAVIEAMDAPHGWSLRVRHPFFHDTAGDRPYRQTIAIEPLADGVSRVTVTLDDIDTGSATDRLLSSGTRFLLDSFKSFVETGAALPAA